MSGEVGERGGVEASRRMAIIVAFSDGGNSENGRQRTRAGRAMRWRSTYRYHRVRHGAGPMPCAPRAEDAR